MKLKLHSRLNIKGGQARLCFNKTFAAFILKANTFIDVTEQDTHYQKSLKVFSIFIVFIVLCFLPLNRVIGQCTNPTTNYDGCNGLKNAFNRMNIPCAWQITNGDPNVLVAVFDTDFQDDHDDLIGKIPIVYRANCTISNQGNQPFSHGTSSAGAIAGIRNNNFCVSGSGGDIRIVGYCQPADDAGIMDAADKGYKIIYIAHWNIIHAEAVQYCVDKGSTVVIASLNNEWEYLKDIKGVIIVGLTYEDRTFDQYVSQMPVGIDVFTVGSYEQGGLCKLIVGNSCQETGGTTSLCAGFVAGVVGLMRSVNPCLNPIEIEDILEATAGPIPTFPISEGGGPLPAGTAEHGIINAYEAVLMAQKTSLTTWLATNQTIDQNTHVHNTLHLTNEAPLATSALGSTYLFKSITLDADLTVVGDLVVNTGVRFIVNGNISFGENSRLIIKRGAIVEVNGDQSTTGILTSGACGNRWQGSIVEGNTAITQKPIGRSFAHTTDNGSLVLNGATISFARDAVSMEVAHLPWPNNGSYGGLLIANNTRFDNNKRAVAFMRYGKQDQSTLTNCTIEGEYGTTHWANSGVVYDNVTFNIQKEGIYTVDADIVVRNSTFNLEQFGLGDEIGIYLDHTSPSSADASIIENNDFIGGQRGLRKRNGITKADDGIITTISNNHFLGIDKAVQLDGAGNCDVLANDITGSEVGMYVSRLGEDENDFEDNQLIAFGEGINAYYNCSGFNFTNNCFNAPSLTQTAAIEVTGESSVGNPNGVRGEIQSEVFSIINGEDGAAGNCLDFTSATANMFRFINLHRRYTYFYKDVTGCRTNKGYIPNQQVDPQDNLICGTSIIPTPRYRCNLRFAHTDSLNKEITHITTTIGVLADSLTRLAPQSSQWYAVKLQIIRMQKCLKLLKYQRISFLARRAEYPQLISLHQSEAFIYKAVIIGELIKHEAYTEAQDYITNLPRSTQEETDFLLSQQLLISKLTDPHYVLSNNDRSSLYLAARRPHPLCAYAGSVYRLLTGDDVEVELPVEDDNPDGGQRMASTDGISVRCYPNPMQDVLYFETSKKDVSIEIFNMAGQLIVSKKINYLDQYHIADMPSGLYTVLFKDTDGSIIKSDKIIR